LKKKKFIGQYGKTYMKEMLSLIERPPELCVPAQTFGPDSDSTSKFNYENVHGSLLRNITAFQQNYYKTEQSIEYVNWKQQQQQQQQQQKNDDDNSSIINSTDRRHHQMSLIPTLFWYDNVHICETSHYRDFVFNSQYKMVVRGGFIEDKLSPVIKKTVERLGLAEGFRRFGCYLLDDHSGMFFTGHCDGGSFIGSAMKAEIVERKKKQSLSMKGQQEQQEQQQKVVAEKANAAGE
jgi:hypothetical protein